MQGVDDILRLGLQPCHLVLHGAYSPTLPCERIATTFRMRGLNRGMAIIPRCPQALLHKVSPKFQVRFCRPLGPQHIARLRCHPVGSHHCVDSRQTFGRRPLAWAVSGPCLLVVLQVPTSFLILLVVGIRLSLLQVGEELGGCSAGRSWWDGREWKGR